MICPMLSALKPIDDEGRPVDRECIYENCRFFNVEVRDCNLMVASRAMMKMAEPGPRAGAPDASPTALTDMERRLTDLGKGLLHSSLEVQGVVAQSGQETIARMERIGEGLNGRLEGLEGRLATPNADLEPRLLAAQRETQERLLAAQSGLPDRILAGQSGFQDRLLAAQGVLQERVDTSLRDVQERLAEAQREIQDRLASGGREMQERLRSAVQESEARTVTGVQAALAELRGVFEQGIGRLQTRLEEQGRGVAATAAASSSVLEQLGGLAETQQTIAEKLLEEMSLLGANIRKLEQSLTALDGKVDKGSQDGAQTSQLLVLLKGQSEKTHAALRGLHEGNRNVLQAIETQLQRDQADLARKRQEQAEECNNRGVSLYYRGALDAAQQAFRRAIELLPGYPEAHNNLGLVLSKQGQEKEATEAFQEALRLDPSMGEVYNNLGFLYHTSGNFDRAVQMFGQAIQNNTDTAVAYANLGNSLYKMKQADKAVEAWRRALELDPMNESARRNLRMFQQETSQN